MERYIWEFDRTRYRDDNDKEWVSIYDRQLTGSSDKDQQYIALARDTYQAQRIVDALNEWSKS